MCAGPACAILDAATWLSSDRRHASTSGSSGTDTEFSQPKAFRFCEEGVKSGRADDL
jgi:hypothetical protein